MADDTIFSRTEEALTSKNPVHDVSKADKPQEDQSLLDLAEQEAAKQILKEWDASWKAISRYVEQWKVNRARSQGFTGVQLVKKQDRLQAYIPTGAKKGVAGMNKAARLTRRVRAAIFADPPVPEALPGTDADEDRDAAEVSTRILQDLTAEGNLAYTLHSGDAFDLGSDYGSGFLRFWVDETGGGWRPKQIQASPQATDPADPFPVDPQTGSPRPCDPILRYVTADGRFTEERKEAAKLWLPKLRDEVLSGKQVRFLPYDVRDLWEADAVMIGTAVTLGELKRLFPDIASWDAGRITKLVSARPQHFKDILEPHQKDTASESASNTSLVFVCTRIHTQSGRYPEGAYLIAAGEDELLHREDWYDHEHGTPLDLPLTQFKQFTEEGNPYGDGLMTQLGPGNEIRGALLDSMLEHLRRFQNRHVFVPMTSPMQPQQLQSPTGTPIPILPGQEPKYEEVPDFPDIVKEMAGLISADMDDESGLQGAGQGLNPPGVKSAKHQEVILEQVAQGLSDLRQNAERGLIRGWRIMLQLVRCFYTVPQQISWEGDDGRYKQRDWTGVDLGSTRDVRLQRGSFTMMGPQAKAASAWQYAQAGMLTPQDLEHIAETQVSGQFGLQQNPHRLRVRRQIAQWHEGPPDDYQPPPMVPPPPPVPGQPPPPPPNPYAPLLSVIFEPIPGDTEPAVAALRAYELNKAMASTKYHRWNPQWQQGLILAYQQARQATGVPDAQIVQQMQAELQQAKQKLAEAKVSFSGKLADLDEGQTQALLQQEGIQVPPRATPVAGKEPALDPAIQLAHEAQLHDRTMQQKTEEAGIKARTEVEKERIRATSQAAREAKQHARETLLMRQSSKPAPAAGPMTVHVPAAPEAVKAVEAIGQQLVAAVGTLGAELRAEVQAPREVEVLRDKKTGKVVGGRSKRAKE